MLVQTPPMGWNSWNTFGHDISDALIRQMADVMAEGGYRDAGYEYLVIDDCWSLKQRDENGRLVPDPVKFPHGMKNLSDYVHAKGLKFGMYSCAGVLTCAGYPASYDHEFVDAQTFADWGVDFLKYDYCYKPVHVRGEMLYRRMAMALRATGRDILFSACNWGSDNSENWMRSTGAHMYRSTGDIVDNFKSFTDIAMSQESKQCFGAPQCFNDMDMLTVGMGGKGNVGLGGCTDSEYRMHFALWCMFSSPLMIGCDLRSVSAANASLLKNKELIAIDQDPEARPAFRINAEPDAPIYIKNLSDGDYALAMVNMTESDRTFHALLSDAGLPNNSGYGLTFRDILTGEESGPWVDEFCAKVPAHDVKVFRARMTRV